MRDGAIGSTARATNTEGGTGREVAMRDGAIGATGSAAAVLALLALLPPAGARGETPRGAGGGGEAHAGRGTANSPR